MFLTYAMLYLSGPDPASALALLIEGPDSLHVLQNHMKMWQGLVCGPTQKPPFRC